MSLRDGGGMTSDRLRQAITAFDEYRERHSPIGETPDLFAAIASVAEHAGTVRNLEMLEAQRRGYIRKLGWVGSGAKRQGRPLQLSHAA